MRDPEKPQQIIDAAIRVFARDGYYNSRVSDIAREAGMASGTIYLYFRTKDDILVSLFDQVMAEHLAAARQEVAGLDGAPARLRAIAERHLRLLGGNRDLAVVFQVELRQSTKLMERFTASWLKDYFDVVQGVIERGQREGSIRKELPRKVAAKAFFGALDEMVTSWVLSRKDYELSQLAGPVVELFLTGAAAQPLRGGK
jgi:TetR/AcrR family fatty acid metabolism transcriptional regulator